jgi:hypothetical protein
MKLPEWFVRMFPPKRVVLHPEVSRAMQELSEVIDRLGLTDEQVRALLERNREKVCQD